MFRHTEEEPVIIESTIVESRASTSARERAEFNARQEQATAKRNMIQEDVRQENTEAMKRTVMDDYKRRTR